MTWIKLTKTSRRGYIWINLGQCGYIDRDEEKNQTTVSELNGFIYVEETPEEIMRMPKEDRS
jgi:hypothetical protein